MAATLEPSLSFILFHIILIRINTLVTLLDFAFDTNQPLAKADCIEAEFPELGTVLLTGSTA